MKKYLSIALLFLFNNEIVSWMTLFILVAIGLIYFWKEVDYEQSKRD